MSNELNSLDSSKRITKRTKLESSPDYDAKGTRGGKDPATSNVSATEPEDFEAVRKTGMLLWDKMTTLRDPHIEGRYSHHDFITLPPRSEYPDYYEIIKKPVCFNEIKHKLDTLEYSSLYEVRADFNQIFVNAKRYNAPGSSIFGDAKRLHKLMKEYYSILTGEIEPPEEEEPAPPPPPPRIHQSRPLQQYQNHHYPPVASTSAYIEVDVNAPVNVPVPEPLPDDETPTPAQIQAAIDSAAAHAKSGPTLKPWLTKKMAELRALKDASGRAYSDGFASLPDRKSWPEYYRVIKNPMSLDHVAAKVVKRYYLSVQQFVDDISKVFGNAQFFNEETSRIWKDARVMQHHFAEVMKEVPPHFSAPRKYNTTKRRAELDAEAQGLPIPESGYKKRQKREQSGSQPPEYGMNGSEYNDSENEEYDEMYNIESGADNYASPFELPTFPQPGGGSYGSPVQSRSPSGTPGVPTHFQHHGSPFRSQILSQPSPHPQSPMLLSEFGTQLLNGQQHQPPFPHGSPLSSNTPLSLVNGNSGMNSLYQATLVKNLNAKPADPPKPRTIARVTSKSNPSAITKFLVQTHPSNLPSITLHNDSVRQHSFSISSTTERVDFTPIFRRPSPPSLSNGDHSSTTIIPFVPPFVGLSVKPIGTRFETIPSGEEQEEEIDVYSLVPGVGLTIVEIAVGEGEGRELYRIFVTK